MCYKTCIVCSIFMLLCRLLKIKMRQRIKVEKSIFSNIEKYHPGFSVDCVVITYHQRKVKILLNKSEIMGSWMLPGGFVGKDEDVDDAVHRILRERTGLKDIYLQQFHLFGKANRTNLMYNKKILDLIVSDPEELENYEKFFVKRFISMGYFALVNFENISTPEKYEDICNWFSIDEIPPLYTDHNLIIEKAIGVIQFLIDSLPIGYQLLPEKFILPDLRCIYECILGKKLDKRNFQKKMLSSGAIIRLDERKIVNTYPHPYYYTFNKDKIKNWDWYFY